MDKEMQSYWDKTTLSEYLNNERIPRGLIIKKFPTFYLFKNDLKKRWTDSLSTCSHSLMSLITESKTKEIDKLQDIYMIQQDILPLKDLTQFVELEVG